MELFHGPTFAFKDVALQVAIFSSLRRSRLGFSWFCFPGDFLFLGLTKVPFGNDFCFFSRVLKQILVFFLLLLVGRMKVDERNSLYSIVLGG